jgi:hypothetical protein
LTRNDNFLSADKLLKNYVKEPVGFSNMQKRVQTASQEVGAMELQKINEDAFKEKLNYKNHKRVFNPKSKGAFTNRGSNREIETQESS